MVKVRGKKNTSKRKTLKLKHKIVKKAAEKKRKLNKDAKLAVRAGVTVRKKKDKKLVVPNNWPFKAQELLAMKQREDAREAEMEKQKQLNRQKVKVSFEFFD